MSVRSYEAWLVDLDGTLYDAKWVKIAMACELAIGGWGAVRTLRRFRHAHEALRGAWHARRRRARAFRYAAHSHGT
jgi:hypothetical protein